MQAAETFWTAALFRRSGFFCRSRDRPEKQETKAAENRRSPNRADYILNPQRVVGVAHIRLLTSTGDVLCRES
jgi:hypothetical protein